jgi:hypothetical protein
MARLFHHDGLGFGVDPGRLAPHRPVVLHTGPLEEKAQQFDDRRLTVWCVIGFQKPSFDERSDVDLIEVLEQRQLWPRRRGPSRPLAHARL